MSLVKRFYINKADCSVYDSRWAMGKAAAELTASIIVKLQQEQDEVNLLMSVGQSQHTMLDALLGYAAIDWRKVNIFHVDEKLTLAGDNPLSGQQRLSKQDTFSTPWLRIRMLNAPATQSFSTSTRLILCSSA